MSKYTVKICDRCNEIVAYKDGLLFGSWIIVRNYIEAKYWYNGSDFDHGEAFPVAAKKTYHVCEKCFNKGANKSFSEVLAAFQAKQMRGKKND